MCTCVRVQVWVRVGVCVSCTQVPGRNRTSVDPSVGTGVCKVKCVSGFRGRGVCVPGGVGLCPSGVYVSVVRPDTGGVSSFSNDTYGRTVH